MAKVREKVWSSGRKWMGNLIPALLFLPFASYGVYLMFQPHAPTVGPPSAFTPPLKFLLLGTVLGWLGANFFGLYQNSRMRRDMERNFMAGAHGKNEERYFVGFSTPRFASMLDAHEDVGFLVLHKDELEFFGETHKLRIPKAQITRFRFRPNVHTWVGLGRWTCAEGVVDGKPIRLSIEPRERATLLGNLLYSRKLIRRLRAWRSGSKS